MPQPADEAAAIRRALMVAMACDGDAFRAFLDMFTVIARPEDVLAGPV